MNEEMGLEMSLQAVFWISKGSGESQESLEVL